MAWDGVERRSGSENLKTDVALIKQEVGHVKDLIEGQNKMLTSVVDQVKYNTEHRIRMNGIKDSFHGHVVQDRWLFGLIITMIIGLFVKIVFA